MEDDGRGGCINTSGVQYMYRQLLCCTIRYHFTITMVCDRCKSRKTTTIDDTGTNIIHLFTSENDQRFFREQSRKNTSKYFQMASAFSFRQRVGKLDWKLISSINLEDIILNMKISELQGVLDEVTFCDFSAVDVKGNTVDSISKLVQLMQLICEYLLH